MLRSTLRSTLGKWNHQKVLNYSYPRNGWMVQFSIFSLSFCASLGDGSRHHSIKQLILF
jgi:hypothetical protein